MIRMIRILALLTALVVSISIALAIGNRAYAHPNHDGSQYPFPVPQGQWPGYQVPLGPPSAPWSEDTDRDRLAVLHAMSMALNVMENVGWVNRNSGHEGMVYIEHNYQRGCMTLTEVLIRHGVQRRTSTMVACRGGGNSNTWIIDNLWHLNSTTQALNGWCQTRFVDARLSVGPAQSVANVCFYPQYQLWIVEG